MGCCQRYGYFVPLFFGCLFFFGAIGFDFLISMGISQELGKVGATRCLHRLPFAHDTQGTFLFVFFPGNPSPAFLVTFSASILKHTRFSNNKQPEAGPDQRH